MASLVLLATLVAGMVVAYSAHHRQALLAIHRQKAARAADEQLAIWYSSDEPNVPRNGFGPLPGPSGFVWQTNVVHQNMIESLPVEVVRLQVFRADDVDASDPNGTPNPLAQVDVMLPIPESRWQ